MASKSKKRRRVFRASCILAALIIAGSSFAWFTSKDEVTNRLAASTDYGVSIVESFVPPKQWMPGQEINKDVYAVNTGNIDAFVKESISANLTYTYEKRVSDAPTNAAKEGYVRLDTDSVRAIDGATTMEVGGFIAWVNQFTTIYKLDGTEVETGTGANKIEELAASVYAKLDGSATATEFKYKYNDGTNDYYATGLTENATFVKFAGGATGTGASTDPYVATTDSTKTLTVDYTPTPGEVNSATLTDVAQSADGSDSPAAVAGTRWHPTETGVYVFRRSYVPNNAADADQNAVTYKFNGKEVEEADFKVNESDADGWDVTDTNAVAADNLTGKFKYKITDTNGTYYGKDIKNGTVFYKETTTGTIDSSANTSVNLVRNQEGYFTYAAYYYLAPEDDGSTTDVDESKNEGEYYKVVLGSDDFRAIETDGTGTAKTYIFDVSATQYQLGYPNTIEVDPVTGKITGDVAYSFVKEIKRENVAPTLTYHHTSDTAHDSVAYLEAVYTDGTSDDGNYQNKKAIAETATTAADTARREYLDKEGDQAQKEIEYDNAVGAYNSAKSRYDQAKADWEYAMALSKASKDLIDAAGVRADAQAEYDEANDKFNASYNAVKKVAKDMRGNTDTQPAVQAAPSSTEGVYTDLLKFGDATDISYNKLFQTDNNGDHYTLETIIQEATANAGDGNIANDTVLTDTDNYRKDMLYLWDDATKPGNTVTTKNSIVGAVDELWAALADFNTLSKTSTNGADKDATRMLKRVKDARDNLESLLRDYKALYQQIETNVGGEAYLTQLDAINPELAGVEGKIDAWIARLTAMQNDIEEKKNSNKIGSILIGSDGTITDTDKPFGMEAIVKDFVIKYNNYATESAKDLPAAKSAWEQALRDYNKAVQNGEAADGTKGAAKIYEEAIKTDQRVRDPYHDVKDDNGNVTSYAWQKNDYEGLKTTSTAEVTGDHNGTEQQWWLTDNSTILVGEYAVQRPTGGDPKIAAFNDSDVLKPGTDGEDLWTIIGKTAGMPAGDTNGASNWTFYDPADPATTVNQTSAAEYTPATYVYDDAVIAQAKTTEAGWNTLVADPNKNGTSSTPAYPTVDTLKTQMNTAKGNATTATSAYAQAIADTAAAKKASERADQVRDGAIAAANDALAADESAIRINIYLDDQNDKLDWTSALADGASAEVADFYYNYILGAGLTSEKLIDSVELDPSLTAKDYKELVFDLNVKLDSAQITYDNDQRTITTTAVDANDEFKMNPTVGRESTDGKGVAVTWDGSGSVSPTTTYRVGTNPVTPKKVDAKTVTGQTGDNVDLNANDYIYEIEVSTKKYYGRSLADGTKFYFFGSAGDAIVPADSITLNIVE